MKMNSQQPLKVLVSEENLPRVMNNITRRKLLSLGAVAGGAALLSACSGGTASKGSVESLATGGELEPSLTVFSWGDYDLSLIHI